MQYKSIASWPPESGIGISEDTHNTREQAEAVCQILRRDGFGGEGKIFPTATEVREIQVLVSWENQGVQTGNTFRDAMASNRGIHTNS